MIPERKRFYIAGPMTGIPQFNFPAFDVAAASLRAAGYLVVSPVELDDPSSRSAALANETGDPEQYNADTGETWGDLLARDVKLIADEVSGVVALEGWEDSRGARLEVFVARTCGKPVYSYEEWLNDRTPGCPLTDDFLIPDWEIADVMHETVFHGSMFIPNKPVIKTHKFRTQNIDPEVMERLREADRKLRESNPLMADIEDKLRRHFEDTIVNGHTHRGPEFVLQGGVTGRLDHASGRIESEAFGSMAPGDPVTDGRGKAIGRVTSCKTTEEGVKVEAEVDGSLLKPQPAEECAAPSDLDIAMWGAGVVNPREVNKVRGNSPPASAPTGEVRVTSETGGQKGKKPQAVALIPPEAILALSEVYGMGAEKYDDHNYLKGYDWSLSFSSLFRHALAAANGDWLDEESGLPHVMHAAWHCFCLFMFEKHGLGNDDRIKTVVEGLDG